VIGGTLSLVRLLRGTKPFPSGEEIGGTYVPTKVATALWEVQLHERLLARDRDALGECYDQFATLVYTVALRTTADRAQADDVTQDVFLKLWANPLDVDLSRGTMRSWLGRVAHNRAVDVVRSDIARERRERNTADLDVPDIGEAFEAMLRSEQVRAALEMLPGDQSTPIRLAYFSNMTYRSVAAVLGIPEGTAKSRIRTGLERMAAALHTGASEPGS
jgi:RNA polymerase sigma factor (sigma-70 family)